MAVLALENWRLTTALPAGYAHCSRPSGGAQFLAEFGIVLGKPQQWERGGGRRDGGGSRSDVSSMSDLLAPSFSYSSSKTSTVESKLSVSCHQLFPWLFVSKKNVGRGSASPICVQHDVSVIKFCSSFLLSLF
jgi:hypothetical protein